MKCTEQFQSCVIRSHHEQSAFALTAMLGFLAVAVVHARTWSSHNRKNVSVKSEMTGFKDGRVILGKDGVLMLAKKGAGVIYTTVRHDHDEFEVESQQSANQYV